MPKENNKEMKIGIFGSKHSGKTSLFNKFYNNTFKNQTIATASPKQFYQYYKIDNKCIMLHMWDTPAIEYYSLIDQYVFGLDGIILTVDLTSRVSFEIAKSFLYKIRTIAQDDESVYLTNNILLAGCKEDLTSERQVTDKEVTDFASKEKICYIETSALNGSGINQCFEYTITVIYNEAIKAKKK